MPFDQNAPKPRDYRHIEVWGLRLGSHRTYIHDQQVMAAADGAPLDAIYKRDGKWITARDVTNPDALADFKKAGL